MTDRELDRRAAHGLAAIPHASSGDHRHRRGGDGRSGAADEPPVPYGSSFAIIVTRLTRRPDSSAW